MVKIKLADARRPSDTRSNELTRDRIVDAAIALLDAEGESGLTFRTLALKLNTGHGAIQWHIANKHELLVATTVSVLTPALARPGPDTSPRHAIHTVALKVFDAIDAHPWLTRQLFAVPWQPAMVQLWEQLGRPVEELGVPEQSLLTGISTLVNYIIGAGGQNAVNTHEVATESDRAAFLDVVAGHWESLDANEHPVVRRLASQLREHDDREQFLASIDIIIAGLAATQ